MSMVDERGFVFKEFGYEHTFSIVMDDIVEIRNRAGDRLILAATTKEAIELAKKLNEWAHQKMEKVEE